MAEVDRKYCSSSYLIYRAVIDESKQFSDKYPLRDIPYPSYREPIRTSDELYAHLKNYVDKLIGAGKKVSIALSGGIDSAIIAKLVPRGTIAYTFKCVVPGVQVTDESQGAARYAEECGLDHRVVEIYWEDFAKYAPDLMKRKGSPIHSIEIQIHKAALQAKQDGCEVFLFGECADCIYGGHSDLLSKDYTFGQFVERWSFVQPYAVLKDFEYPLQHYQPFVHDGMVDSAKFLSIHQSPSSYKSYDNACALAGVRFATPFADTIMAEPLDLERVRRGENKYLVREVFQKLYPNWEIPGKVPMPRPMGEWLKDWEGPKRPEFWPNCHIGMTGDQRWMIYALEQFLNIIDE